MACLHPCPTAKRKPTIQRTNVSKTDSDQLVLCLCLRANARSADRSIVQNGTNQTSYFQFSVCVCITHDTNDTRLRPLYWITIEVASLAVIKHFNYNGVNRRFACSLTSYSIMNIVPGATIMSSAASDRYCSQWPLLQPVTAIAASDRYCSQ